MSFFEGHNRYRYRDVGMQKNPIDIALYMLALWKLKPRTIIEIGSNRGGSALWFSDLCKTYDLDCRVYSVDCNRNQVVVPERDGLCFIEGNAHKLEIALPVEMMETIARPLFVSEDSSHEPETTLAVLEFIDRWLHPGEYIVVEDGIVASLLPGHHNGGPLVAIRQFLATHSNYSIDRELCDWFGPNATFNQDGWIRKDN